MSSLYRTGTKQNHRGGNFKQAPPNNDWTPALPIDTADDTGTFVKGILLDSEKVLGKRIYGATDYYTVNQILEKFQEQFPEAGKTAKYVELPQRIFKDVLG